MTTLEQEILAARIAVIEDERAIRELLERGLGRAGFEVSLAADGHAGLQLVRAWRPDAIVLDIMLPKVDGITLLPMLRRETDAPILVLSARGEVRDRIEGINRGADDYLAKPFDMDELTVRLRALLRRPTLHAPAFLAFADLLVELETRVVRRGTRPITLSTREFQLLTVLLRHPRKVFSKDELLDRIWGDADVSAGSVETYIGYLRAKIDREGETKLLHTIRGVGYALRAE